MNRLIELDRQNDIAELAGTFLENKKTDEVEERINPYSLKFDENGEPDFKYEMETDLGKAEYKGMKNVWNLAREGYKYVFWLSPSGGRSIYDQGRISVGVVKNSEKVEIECRGIPILVTASELYAMGKEIVDCGGKTIDLIEKAEDLREQAIGINLKNEEQLWYFCRSIFGMEKVWKAIIKGKDISNKREIIKTVDEVLVRVKNCYGSFNSNNSIESGALFEKEMQIRGYQMVGGNHGDLNSNLVGETSFDKLFSNSEISVKPEIRDGKKYCPCGTEIKEGMTVCPDCGLKISSVEN
jgi:hypothetical protein